MSWMKFVRAILNQNLRMIWLWRFAIPACPLSISASACHGWSLFEPNWTRISVTLCCPSVSIINLCLSMSWTKFVRAYIYIKYWTRITIWSGCDVSLSQRIQYQSLPQHVLDEICSSHIETEYPYDLPVTLRCPSVCIINLCLSMLHIYTHLDEVCSSHIKPEYPYDLAVTLRYPSVSIINLDYMEAGDV
jgi:hypothetical protein